MGNFLFGGLLVNGLALLAIVVVAASILGPTVRALRETGLGPAAMQARRRSWTASAVAGLSAFGVAVLLLSSGNGELVLALTPVLVGCTCVVVAIAAERMWPRPTGTVRTATLRRPGIGSTSRSMSRLALSGGVATVALLLFALLTAAPGGRRVALSWPEGGTSIGPYPGSHFAWPLLGGVAALALLTLVGLRVVDARPALGPGLEEVDAAAREASRMRVLRGTAFALLATASALALVIAGGWAQMMSTARSAAPNHFGGWAWDLVQPLGFAGVIAALDWGFSASRCSSRRGRPCPWLTNPLNRPPSMRRPPVEPPHE